MSEKKKHHHLKHLSKPFISTLIYTSDRLKVQEIHEIRTDYFSWKGPTTII